MQASNGSTEKEETNLLFANVMIYIQKILKNQEIKY